MFKSEKALGEKKVQIAHLESYAQALHANPYKRKNAFNHPATYAALIALAFVAASHFGLV